MKTFTVDIFSGNGIAELQKAVEAEKKRLENGMGRLVRKAAERGRDLAKEGFSAAKYAGELGQDTVEAVPGGGENEMIVRAEGPTAQFIEFGTGVFYPDDYPEPVGRGLRGTYGNHQGRNPNGWHYNGGPGNLGEFEENEGKWKGWVHTYGNPANAPMYNSKKTLLGETQALVDGAFESDT